MESVPSGGTTFAYKPAVPSTKRVFLAHVVALVEHATRQVILNHCRVREVSFARFIAFYLARRVAHASFQRIANFFGMTKATVIYGVRKIEAQLATDPALAKRIAALTEALNQTTGE